MLVLVFFFYDLVEEILEFLSEVLEDFLDSVEEGFVEEDFIALALGGELSEGGHQRLKGGDLS